MQALNELREGLGSRDTKIAKLEAENRKLRYSIKQRMARHYSHTRV